MLGLIAALLFTSTAQFSAIAETVGWSLKGDAPMNYQWGVETGQTHDGAKVAYLRFNEQKFQPSSGPGFGTLMQMFDAADYAGKRVRFSGFLKTKDVVVHSAIWMRVDGNRGNVLDFDNMSDRGIVGTTDWKKYEVVLDVPSGALEIGLGTMLTGQGEIWISGLKLETVDKNVPTTGMHKSPTPKQPVDLDFALSK